MAETSGFFDAEELLSGNYDREYVSEQFAQYFALFIGNGVFASPTNQLKVVAGEGMNIVVKEGWAFINGRWYHNDSDLTIPVPPNTTATAITSGVFVQQTKSDRDIHSILATGRTIPDREEPYWELKLAELQIPVGATSITDAMITDTRTNENVCGFVKGLLDGVITTEDLFAQYDAIFMDFYNRMKDQLSEDAAGHLQIEIDNLSDSIAPQYDPSQTYGKGWVRMYHNKRYRSNQAITEPESWTPEHWTEENLDIALSEISDVDGHLQVEIDKNTKDISDVDERLAQNINSIQSQITKIQSQIPKVKKEFKTLTTNAGANILLNGKGLTVKDYDIIIPSNGTDTTMSAGLLYNSVWVLWNNSGYLYSHGAFTALCIKFN